LRLARAYQEHDGPVDEETTLFVDYHYDSPRISRESPRQEHEPVKYVRLDRVMYPNGREVNYDYDYGTDAAEAIQRSQDGHHRPPTKQALP